MAFDPPLSAERITAVRLLLVVFAAKQLTARKPRMFARSLAGTLLTHPRSGGMTSTAVLVLSSAFIECAEAVVSVAVAAAGSFGMRASVLTRASPNHRMRGFANAAFAGLGLLSDSGFTEHRAHG